MNAAIRDPEIEFLTSGSVSDHDVERAGHVLRGLFRHSTDPVRSARVTLSVVSDPQIPRPALAQAVVDLGDRRLRAQAAAPTLEAAISLLKTRLTLRQPN